MTESQKVNRLHSAAVKFERRTADNLPKRLVDDILSDRETYRVVAERLRNRG